MNINRKNYKQYRSDLAKQIRKLRKNDEHSVAKLLNQEAKKEENYIQAKCFKKVDSILNTINNNIKHTPPLSFPDLIKKRKHPLSKALPYNNNTIGDYNDIVPLNKEHKQKVTFQLDGYHYKSTSIQIYKESNTTNQKTSFLDKNNLNLGWKLHLDVLPADVKQVATYLVQNDYTHKYLCGGGPSDGKVFTIYIGGRQIAENAAQTLSSDLKGILCKPKAEEEIEFQVGVVGRFVCHLEKNTYNQYGDYGISYLEKCFKELYKEKFYLNHIKLERIQKLHIQENDFKKISNLEKTYILNAQHRMDHERKDKDIRTGLTEREINIWKLMESYKWIKFKDIENTLTQFKDASKQMNEYMLKSGRESFDQLKKDYGKYFTG